MEEMFAEMPLVLFTSLASIAAGTFIALALVFFTTKLSDEQAQKLDKLSWIPFAVLIAGFIAAFFHLTQPFNAVYVFSGIGRSPMSNEIIVGVIFCALIFVYCLLGTLGKLKGTSRKALLGLVVVAALAFLVSIGMAYMIRTIVSWNTILVPCAIIGFGLFGGTLLGLVLLNVAGALGKIRESSGKNVLLAVLIIGALISIASTCAFVIYVSGISTLVADGAALTSEVMVPLIVAGVAMLLALVGGFFSLCKNDSLTLSCMSVIAALIAIMLARMIFYAMGISVAL